MNASLSSSSSRRSSGARLSFAGQPTASIPAGTAHARISPAGFTYASVAAPSEDFFRQMWAPGLLDQLEARLTRYRE